VATLEALSVPGSGRLDQQPLFHSGPFDARAARLRRLLALPGVTMAAEIATKPRRKLIT
jgi:hypothetical protein